MENITTIKVTGKTKDRLENMKMGRDRYEDLLNRLMDFYEDNHDENVDELEKMIKKHEKKYHLLSQ